MENSTKLVNKHYCYLVLCSDGSLYCGYTTDLQKRIHAHNNLKSGAKYTRSRRPVKLVYYEAFESKSMAMQREYTIKQMPVSIKRKLITSHATIQN